MKNLIKFSIVFLLIFSVNVSFENAEEQGWVRPWLRGTWIVQNETIDTLYSGYLGQVTFYKDELVIDSGRFAAAGLVHNSEDTISHWVAAPILCKFISSQHIYLSWNGLDTKDKVWPKEAMSTIVKRKGNKITVIGQGGYGRMGTPRISYLEKVGE